MYSIGKYGIVFSALISTGGERDARASLSSCPGIARDLLGGLHPIPLLIILELNHLHFCCSPDSVRNTHPQGVTGTFLWVDNGSD